MARVNIGGTGFAQRGVFDQFNRAMRTAIPVFLQKKRLEFAKEEEDREFERLMEQSKQDHIQSLLKLKAEEDKAALDIATDNWATALETGNEELGQSSGRAIEGLTGRNLLPKTNVEVGPMQPGEDRLQYTVPEVEEPPKPFNEKAMLWQASGQDPAKYMELLQGMKSKGLALTVGADGEIAFTQGGAPGQGMTAESLSKKTRSKIEDKAFNAVEGLGDVGRLIRDFDPALLEFGTRAKAVWKGFQRKLGANLQPEDKELVQKYFSYQKTSLGMINKYIKSITGAQMSEKEADRIRKALPDFGEHWWSGNDPISFIDALKSQHKQLKLSMVRYNLLLSEGMTDQALKNIAEKNPEQLIYSLDEVENMIQRRGEEYANSLQKEGVTDPQELSKLVSQQLSQVFGVSF